MFLLYLFWYSVGTLSMDIKIINSDSPVRTMENRLLNRNFKVKILLSSYPTTIRFSFWDQLIKFNVTCRYFLIPEHDPKIVITHEIFHYDFLLLTLPTGASNKILKTNIVMERYLCS